MLSLILIYFIGKAFYDLADSHHRHKWGMALAGLAAYFGSQLLLGIVLAIIFGIDAEDRIMGMNDFLLNIICIVVGAIATWVLYVVLKNNWTKNQKLEDQELLDHDLL